MENTDLGWFRKQRKNIFTSKNEVRTAVVFGGWNPCWSKPQKIELGSSPVPFP
jgi:hypothetical protein